MYRPALPFGWSCMIASVAINSLIIRDTTLDTVLETGSMSVTVE